MRWIVSEGKRRYCLWWAPRSSSWFCSLPGRCTAQWEQSTTKHACNLHKNPKDQFKTEKRRYVTQWLVNSADVKANGNRCFKKDRFVGSTPINAVWEEFNIKGVISNFPNMKNMWKGAQKQFRLICFPWIVLLSLLKSEY